MCYASEMAAPTTVLTIVKRMPYRLATDEEYSNTYMLTGSTPANSAAWRTLFDEIVAQEKTLYKSDVQVIKGYGYSTPPAAGVVAVWSVDLRVAPNSPVNGTLAGGTRQGGDTAAWVRWGLDRLNAKGKRVYLRKYFHPAYVASGSATPDVVESTWVTAAAAFGTKLRDGTLTGGRVIVDRLGTLTIGAGVSSFTTTRTLKRRSKKNPT